MKRHHPFALICTAIIFCGCISSAYSELAIDEASIYPASILRELQLMRPLMVETNQSFDEAICKSIRTNSTQTLVVSYQEISFVFHYPTTNHLDAPSSSKIDNLVVPSSSEIGHPYQLLCKQTGVSRVTLYTNDVPLNYIRLYDPSQKQISAELDLLLGVSSLENPQDIRYVRRSFHFTYKDGWKGDY